MDMEVWRRALFRRSVEAAGRSCEAVSVVLHAG